MLKVWMSPIAQRWIDSFVVTSKVFSTSFLLRISDNQYFRPFSLFTEEPASQWKVNVELSFFKECGNTHPPLWGSEEELYGMRDVIYFSIEGWNIYSLVQDCSISIANVLEILQSCTQPSIYLKNCANDMLLVFHSALVLVDVLKSSGLFHWYWDKHTTFLVPVKQPWRIWVNGYQVPFIPLCIIFQPHVFRDKTEIHIYSLFVAWWRLMALYNFVIVPVTE